MCNKCPYSVKEVAFLPVQVVCICFVKCRDVLLKIPLKEQKMSTTDCICILIYILFPSHNIQILKLNKAPTIKEG